MTKHAQKRAHQRHIGSLTVELLRRYGSSERAPGGARLRILKKSDRRRLLNELRVTQKNLEAAEPPYLIETDDGQVVTTGRRTRKIRR